MTSQNNQKSPEQIAREYEAAVDPGLVEFIEKVRSISGDKVNKLEYEVSVIGERQRNDYEKLMGIPLKATHNVYCGSEVNHTVNRHGADGDADQSMSDIRDIARIGYILTDYDNIGFAIDKNGSTCYSSKYKSANNKPSPIMLYVKRINGFHIVAQTVNDSKRKRLYVISTYKNKNNPLKN